MVLSFSNILWLVIAALELGLVAARIFMQPSPLRLSFALMIPALIILGAAINAIYNRITLGRVLDDVPPVKRS